MRPFARLSCRSPTDSSPVMRRGASAVTLSQTVDGAALGSPATATVTITDNDAVPMVTVAVAGDGKAQYGVEERQGHLPANRRCQQCADGFSTRSKVLRRRAWITSCSLAKWSSRRGRRRSRSRLSPLDDPSKPWKTQGQDRGFAAQRPQLHGGRRPARQDCRPRCGEIAAGFTGRGEALLARWRALPAGGYRRPLPPWSSAERAPSLDGVLARISCDNGGNPGNRSSRRRVCCCGIGCSFFASGY